MSNPIATGRVDPAIPARYRHMSTVVIHPSKLEPTRLCFRTSNGCTSSLMPERFRDKLERSAITNHPTATLAGHVATALTSAFPSARSTVHTCPVFSPGDALAIALDAQAVGAKLGLTCRGASLKVRGRRTCVGALGMVRGATGLRSGH